MKNQICFRILLLASFSIVYANSDSLISKRTGTNVTETKRDTTIHKANLTGGRSRKAIMEIVMSNISKLKEAYNRRMKLRGKPYFGGKLYIKFAIDEFGKVIYCEAIEDRLGDSTLASQCVRIVKSWQFGNISKPGDITEVIYPFVFSPPEDQIESGNQIIENKKVRHQEEVIEK
jgi:hypothetical protein